MKKIAFITSLMIGNLFAQQPYTYSPPSAVAPAPMPIKSDTSPMPVNPATSSISQQPTTAQTSNGIDNVINQNSNVVGCNISQTPGIANNCVITIETDGIGVAPNSSISPAQATAMARRAAIIDGYKALTEKLYGIKINGKETVRNMVLQNSNLKSQIIGVIRNAKIEEEHYKNGMYKVVMSVKLNVTKWNQYLKKASVYSN